MIKVIITIISKHLNSDIFSLNIVLCMYFFDTWDKAKAVAIHAIDRQKLINIPPILPNIILDISINVFSTGILINKFLYLNDNNIKKIYIQLINIAPIIFAFIMVLIFLSFFVD